MSEPDRQRLLTYADCAALLSELLIHAEKRELGDVFAAPLDLTLDDGAEPLPADPYTW